MKLKIRSLSTFALATGLLLSTSQIQPVHADDQHERACSNKTLKGSYGSYRTGSTSTGPLAAVGILFFDGNGNVSGSQSISRNGVFTFDAAISGLYEVAADCTARFLTDTGDEVARVLIVDGGKEFYELSETSGNAVYGVAKKIHTDDDDRDR
jgi:hypothetical protein